MQSVEAEDLFESNNHPLLPSRRLVFSLHLPCRIPSLPRWSLASQVDTALSFLHQVYLFILVTCLGCIQNLAPRSFQGVAVKCNVIHLYHFGIAMD